MPISTVGAEVCRRQYQNSWWVGWVGPVRKLS